MTSLDPVRSTAFICGHSFDSYELTFTSGLNSRKQPITHSIRMVDLGQDIRPRFWFTFRDIYEAVSYTRSGHTGRMFDKVTAKCPGHTTVLKISFVDTQTQKKQTHLHQVITKVALGEFITQNKAGWTQVLSAWFMDTYERLIRPIEIASHPRIKNIRAKDLFDGRLACDMDGKLRVVKDLNGDQAYSLSCPSISMGTVTGNSGDIKYDDSTGEDEYDEDDDVDYVPPPAPAANRRSVACPVSKAAPKAQQEPDEEETSSCTDLVRVDENNHVVVDSLMIAQQFSRRHADVLLTISRLNCSEEFAQRNFVSGVYMDKNNQSRPLVTMTRDGAVFLVSKLKGSEAGVFLERYIDAFNRMEAELRKPTIPVPAVDNSVILKVMETLAGIVSNQGQTLASHDKAIATLSSAVVNQTEILNRLTSSPNARYQDDAEFDDSPLLDDDEKEEIRLAQERWQDDNDASGSQRSGNKNSPGKLSIPLHQFLRSHKIKLSDEDRRKFALEATRQAKAKGVLTSMPHDQFGKLNLYPVNLLKGLYSVMFGLLSHYPKLIG
jgi:Rha family phage regulatory protein